ncbi:MAG: hypothetical protein AAGI66_01140 [Cyanobacteria bacterium P01_H01_bin.74]
MKILPKKAFKHKPKHLAVSPRTQKTGRSTRAAIPTRRLAILSGKKPVLVRQLKNTIKKAVPVCVGFGLGFMAPFNFRQHCSQLGKAVFMLLRENQALQLMNGQLFKAHYQAELSRITLQKKAQYGFCLPLMKYVATNPTGIRHILQKIPGIKHFFSGNASQPLQNAFSLGLHGNIQYPKGHLQKMAELPGVKSVLGRGLRFFAWTKLATACSSFLEEGVTNGLAWIQAGMEFANAPKQVSTITKELAAFYKKNWGMDVVKLSWDVIKILFTSSKAPNP